MTDLLNKKDEMKNKISIVVSCFNEQQALPIYYETMVPVMKQIENAEFELIFVDDGSSDHTLAIMKDLASKDPRCHYISFSRNFGKESAIYAGLCHASGNIIGLMDVDLQDPPALLPEMVQIILDGKYDSVATKRSTRDGEPKIRSFLSESFYTVINKLSKIEIVNGARDYRLMTRQMLNAVLEMSEYNRFSKGLFQWVGFKTKWLEYKNIERSAGETKWSMRKLFLYSIDGITGFSVAPLSFAAIIGLLFCSISFLVILIIIVRTLIWDNPVDGWPSLVCIIFFVSGIQLFCTGIVGQYLAKTYLESKHRPIYILRDSDLEESHHA